MGNKYKVIIHHPEIQNKRGDDVIGLLQSAWDEKCEIELVDNYGAMYEDTIEDAKFLKEVVEPNWEEVKKSSRYFEVISPITGEAIGVAVKSGSPVKGKEN